MSYSFYSYLWFFMIYAFLGWWVEVAFQTLKLGKFVNRGFLNGPVTPIYGFGMVILLYFLSPLEDHLILLFLAAVVLTTSLEFITGYTLEHLFHDKWWDYSDLPFNIKGYVTLSFSIAWGLAAVFVLKIIQPLIVRPVSLLNNRLGQFLLFVLIIYFIADFTVTLLGILDIKKRFTILDEMADRLQLYSDEIGVEIFKKTESIMKIADRTINEGQSKKNLSIPELKEMHQKIAKRKGFVHKRLEKSYPNLKGKLKNFGEDLK